MSKFMEFIIEGNNHTVNVDNIAMIKQLDINTLEFHLLTKTESGEQIRFTLNYPLGDIKFKLTELGKYLYYVPFVVSMR